MGVATTRDAASFSSSAFGGAADFGDQEAITKAIVADINARGGVLGRRITPVFHDYSTAQVASDPEAAGQSACADWTQDHKVFAVVNAFPSKILNQCLGRAGTLNFLASPSNYGQALFTTYPRLYGPAVMTDERMVPTWIARLVALKYFTGWNTSAGEAGTGAVKVGLLTQDLRQHPLEDLEKRELARHGITVADTYVYTLPTVGRDMAAAVLRFRSNGITHLLVDTGAFGLFPTVAENQGYRPRYGLNSPVFPQTNGSGNPPAQMHGALGTGYLPYGDVDPGHFTKDVSPAVGRCRDLMRKAGLGTSGSAFLIAQLYCESFSTLFNGLAAGGAPNAVAFASGLSSLTSIQSTLTFSERFAPDRRDSAVGQRDLAYQDDCVCFAYTSATIHRS